MWEHAAVPLWNINIVLGGYKASVTRGQIPLRKTTPNMRRKIRGINTAAGALSEQFW